MEQITGYSQPQRPQQAGPNEVILAGEVIPIVGRVHKQNLGRFPGKVTFGDYSHDSDPLMSTWIIASLTGGIGNEKLKEGVDDETYWTGEGIETRYPGQITLAPYVGTVPTPFAGAGTAYPLGDFPAGVATFWACFGSTLARWNDTTLAFDIVGALPSFPRNKPVEYNGLLYIPHGSVGYSTVDASGTITPHSDYLVRAFCLWDNKLAMLTTTGGIVLRYLNGAWQGPTLDRSLPPGVLPKNLVLYINQRGDATIHVITNQDVWAYDRENDLLYRTQLQFPPHPDNGKASANWRGESLYVSVGLGIHSYNGGVITAMGPDYRYGLPANLRGTITDLQPEYNALIAVVQGESVATDEYQDVEIQTPLYADTLAPFIGQAAYSCVLRWNTFGWHPVWQSKTVGGVPTWAMISVANNRYRLWWGYGEDMYYQDLPRTFFNPKQGMKVGVQEFESTGSLTTGWFDADMLAYLKLTSHVELVLEDVFGDGSSTGRVSVFYQTDTDPGWKMLGETSDVGRSVFWFNKQPRRSRDDFSVGTTSSRIRFRLDLEGLRTSTQDPLAPPRLSPVIQSFQMKFKKQPISQLSFRFTVDLGQTEDFKNRGPGWMADFLSDLVLADEFVEFTHRDRSYRVTVAQTDGDETTGYDKRGNLLVNLVEVDKRQRSRVP